MNTSASEPDGSIREQAPTPELAVGHQWACGMPLSYVLEMADRWLNRHGSIAPTDPFFDQAFSHNRNLTGDTE